MRKLLIFLFLTIAINNLIIGQVDKIMSYNIRYDNPRDSINNWNNRKAEIVNLINHYDPSIFGIQEGLHHQLIYLDENLPNYSRIGVGRNDGKEKGEFTAIYYKHEDLSLSFGSTFWLSQTDSLVSVGWDAALERICTYGVFENRNTKQKIMVFNTHYDHIGVIARNKSSELIVHKIQELNTNDYPVILMGDFNAEPHSKTILTLESHMTDAAKMAPHGIYGPIGTFTGFVKNTIAEKRIDYIFVRGIKAINYRHIDDKMKNNNYLSDHLPVFIELE